MRSYPEIEGLRGLMSLVVVVAHMLAIYHWPARFHGGDSPLFWAVGLMDVFFCISGFLITRNLIKSSTQGPHWVRHYLIKRALRIWPAYYVAVIVAILVSFTVVIDKAPRPLLWNGDLVYLLKTLLFVQNTEVYFGARAQGAGAIPTFDHSWSVAIEEQFYLTIVVVIFLRVRFGLFRGWWLLLPVFAAVPFGQIARHYLPAGWILIGRMDGFLLGIALALLEPGLQQLRERLPMLERAPGRLGTVAILLATIPVLPFLLSHGYPERLPVWFRYGPFEPYLAFSLLGFVVLAVAVADPACPLFRILRMSVPKYFGQISYSMYLFHLPVLYVTAAVLHDAGVDLRWMFPLGAVGVFAAAVIGYHGIESPFMRMKSRVGTRERAGTATEGSGAVAARTGSA